MISEFPSSPDDHHHQLNHSSTTSTKKKRVGKACDSCRIKKTKCDGKKPCNRCLSDNKICVFTEKRKPKEKNHPSGYVELLETRLDILTKSLEKIIILSRDHLPFLNKLIDDGNLSSANIQLSEDEDDVTNTSTSNDTEVIPINNIVTYLINEKGLLKNLPVEWEKGALIAANLKCNNDDDIDLASNQFAKHKLDLKNMSNNNITHDNEIKQEFDDWSPPTSNNSITENINLNDYSLGGYQSIKSEIDLENDSNYHLQSPSNNPSSIDSPLPILDNFPKKANSLFLSNSIDTSNNNANNHELNFKNSNNSLTSLTNKFENHEIKSPTTVTPTTTSSTCSLRRSSSFSKYQQRSISPSMKWKINHTNLSSSNNSTTNSIGHIHKPIRSNSHNNINHHHNHHSNNSLGNTADFMNISKSNSISNSMSNSNSMSPTMSSPPPPPPNSNTIGTNPNSNDYKSLTNLIISNINNSSNNQNLNQNPNSNSNSNSINPNMNNQNMNPNPINPINPNINNGSVNGNVNGTGNGIYDNIESNNIDLNLNLFNSLPSDAFKSQGFDLQGLDIMDTDNIDSLMINNPFLSR